MHLVYFDSELAGKSFLLRSREVLEMKRLTAYVSGKVQKAGYRARVMDFAKAFGLKGFVQNLEDGRVEIIAEVEEATLELFLKAIDIKNTVIRVDSISWTYSNGTSNFADFYKMVGKGETASRLDDGIEILKDILGAIKDMHADLGCKIGDMHADLGNKIDGLGCKIDGLGCKIDDTHADIVGEVRELRKDIKDGELVRMKNDITEIKLKLKLQP
jgi:acylphosphatase